jgi:hypothetical protein
MTDIERQILINQLAVLEALMILMPVAKSGPESTVELLRRRYHETAQLVRQQTRQPSRG